MVNLLTTLLYDWTNGVIMMGVFALVVIILIGVLINFMTKKNKTDN
ncbi:hypothetical protein DFQ05_0941 [Winogradskyella wandonensis]|uniref:Uncharacterized protein n=1 Tax=Winogradskyella wandonensis TaxID=1442586 RepID=A0A4R1KXY3_9FLAO|nr:hypothetical protein [Winogradskyella wandonensis]TCK69420.1 hypothetical protein DFQ05_0941 [Winogradskyella wandonensis]